MILEFLIVNSQSPPKKRLLNFYCLNSIKIFKDSYNHNIITEKHFSIDYPINRAELRQQISQFYLWNFLRAFKEPFQDSKFSHRKIFLIGAGLFVSKNFEALQLQTNIII